MTLDAERVTLDAERVTFQGLTIIIYGHFVLRCEVAVTLSVGVVV